MRLGHALTDQLGVAPDGHVAALLPNRSELVELAIAGPLAGLWVTPINRHLTPDEVAYVVEDSGASVVLTDATLADHVPDGVQVIDVDRDLSALIDGVLRRSARSRRQRRRLDALHQRHHRPAQRGAARPAALAGCGDRRGTTVRGSDRPGRLGPHLVTGPLYHAAPLGLAIYDLYAGAPMVIMDRFDALSTLEAIETHAHRAHPPGADDVRPDAAPVRGRAVRPTISPR